MPGAAWPWKKTWSPDSPWSLPRKKWLKPDLVQRGGGGVGGDVAADAHAGPVRPGHHHGGVPPDVGADPALDVLVAGEPRLALGRDRVDVVGAAQAGHADLLLAGPLEQAQHQVPGPGPASGPDDRVERLDPLAGLVRIDVGQLGRQPVADDGESLTSGSHGVASPSAVSRAAGWPRPVSLVVSMCCPDQSSYELAPSASLLEGNRRAGVRSVTRRGANGTAGGSFAESRVFRYST